MISEFEPVHTENRFLFNGFYILVYFKTHHSVLLVQHYKLYVLLCAAPGVSFKEGSLQP